MQREAPRASFRHRLMRLAGALLLVCAVPAEALTVQLLGASAASEEFEQALRARLGDSHEVVTGKVTDADIVLVLHEGALAESRQSQRPRLLLLPAPGSVALQHGETALYWAPALSDQLRLATRVMPGLRRVGLLVGPQDLARAEALRSGVSGQRLELAVRQATPALLSRQVADLAATTDVLVAPVDAHLYSRDNLKPALMAAYRQNRAFIGPNPAWVRAGALASLYATPGTLAADAALAILAFQEEGRWPAPSHASRFDVITNPQVARALGLRLPDAASLTRAMQSEREGVWP